MRRFLPMLALLFLPSFLFAQWERLPLFGGHADRLIQNKFKPNEMYAIIELGGIYKSTDYGNTWETVVTNIDSLGWTSGIGGIKDFEVAADNMLYVYAQRQIWKSWDKGRIWTLDTALSSGLSNYYGDLEATQDSSIFILHAAQMYLIKFHSKNVSYDTIWLKSATGYNVERMFIDPTDGNIMMLYGIGGELLRSDDKAIHWERSAAFSADQSLFGLERRNVSAEPIYGIWTKQIVPQGGKFDYYESRDSGRNWAKVNDDSVILSDGSSPIPDQSRSDNRHVLMCFLNNLVRSTDGGQSFSLVADVSIWDFMTSLNPYYGSISLDGICTSMDGSVWSQYDGSKKIPGYNIVQFAPCTDAVWFADIGDRSYNRGTMHELLQSTDLGSTWKPLIRGSSITWLQTVPVPDIKYYAVLNSHSLICDRQGQSTPDTLLSLSDEIVQFEIAEAFPSDMFVIFRHGEYYGLYVSRDYGRTWEQRPVPSYPYRLFQIVPSLVEPGCFVAVTQPKNPIDNIPVGLWRCRGYGAEWLLTVQTGQLTGTSITLFDGDRIYNRGRRVFSSDYGITWYTDTTGVEPGEWMSMYGLTYSSEGILFLTTGTYWYMYDGKTWTKLRDERGNPIRRTMPTTVNLVGNELYCGYPHDGLYRIRTSSIAGAPHATPRVTLQHLDMHPNPSSGSVTFSFRASLHYASFLLIVDVLGRSVYQSDIPPGTASFTWNGTSFEGRILSNGTYLALLYEGGALSSSTRILIAR